MAALAPGPTAVTALARRLKALPRALGWIAALVALGAGLGAVPLRLLTRPSGPAGFAWTACVLAVAFAIATALVGRWAGLSRAELGWRAEPGLLRSLALGSALGLVLAGGAVALAHAWDGAAVGLASARPALGWTALALVAAALFEELVFRGAPLRLLARALGPWPATLLCALGFSVAHARNPGATLVSALNIAVAALLLSVAFFSRGGMPLAWGVHWGWNAGLGLVCGAPVSGIPLGPAFLHYAPGGLAWVDGAAFGPEGGVVATAAMCAGLAVLAGRRWSRPREWL